MKKFEITSVNHRRKFEVTGDLNRKPLESIIERLNEEAALQRAYDGNMQRIVRINTRTGEVFTGFFTWGNDISYYLVSNSNMVRRALHRSPEFSIQDRNGRRIELRIECEVSCPPGNEAVVAQALHSSETPAAKFNEFLEQCFDKFRDNAEYFIDNFFTSNLLDQIENSIAGRNSLSTGAGAAYIMGLECHSVKCVWDEPEWEPISIHTGNFDVYFKDSFERHQIIFECNLAVDDKNKINAISRRSGETDFEKIVRQAIQDIYGKFISEDDVFDNFEAAKNTLKTRLDEYLQKYGRKIAGLKLRDLFLERCHFLQNIDLNFKEMKVFAADRKFVEIRELLLTAKLASPKAAKPYKDNPEALKNRLKEVIEAGIGEFVGLMDSGEFYSKIEKTNTDFKKQLVDSINNKTRQIIDADLTLRKIDTGTELQIQNLEGVRKYWTSFSAHIESRIKGECLVEGSFIVIADNPNRREMRNSQAINSEIIRDKILETLKVFLKKYRTATIISANQHEPENFERAIGKLLLDKVDEAYGVIIATQNITTEIINHSNTKELVGVGVNDLNARIIEGIKHGHDVNELKEQKRALEDFEEEEGEKLRQSGNSNSEAANPEEYNSLLQEVNRLLLVGKTSEDVPT